MRLRPETTTSERQLLLALKASGRPVALDELARWRKDGLLPPLAAHGLGQGRGKTYYWHERDIVAQARTAFDLSARHGRPDVVIRLLWLSGFQVPLPGLRRAWLHQMKTRNASKSRGNQSGHRSGGNTYALHFTVGDTDTAQGLLLCAALTLCGAIGADVPREGQAIVALIERALARLGHGDRLERGKVALDRLWAMIRMIGASPDAANLIAMASDEEMRAAQRYLSIAARFLQDCTGEAAESGALWSARLAEHLGPPLFILILVLARSAPEQLERIAAEVKGASPHARNPGRQERSPPAQTAVLHA